MKRFYLLFLLAAQLLNAQDFSNSWEGLFSYQNIVDVVQANDKIYAASDNAIFIYDTATSQFETLSTIDGLIGDNISRIYYSEDKDKLVIGYENGTLQIFDNARQVTTIVAIREKQIISADKKKINEFIELGDLLYIAADFGIALYNLERLEFDDTYFIGDNGIQLTVNAIEIFEGFLYAATIEGGIRRADISSPFLIDFMNWTQINGNFWTELTAFNNRVFATPLNNFLYELNNGAFIFSPINLGSKVLHFATSPDYLAGITRRKVFIYDTTVSEITAITQINGESLLFTNAIIDGDDMYVGTENNGLLRININNQTDFEFIAPDGPSNNSVFSVNAVTDNLWIGYGNYDVFYNPFPLEELGVSNLKPDEPWINFGFNEVLQPRSVSSIAVNPNNTNEVFINSMIDGVVQFEEEVTATIYTDANSSLFDNSYRIPNSKFNRQNDLWVLQSLTDFPLHRRTPSGQWSRVDFNNAFPDVHRNTSSTKIEIDDAGRIYFGTTDDGLFGYDPRTESYGRITEGIQRGDLINNYVGALRIDQNNTLWIGSFLGLRVLSNPSSIFEDQVRDARAIIIEDINGIPRELLADQAIVDIEVDGNNNKWIATSSAGAFLLSPSGQETLLQFTIDNSPLPTNAINDISIDNDTGKIYFATDKGLVAYQGTRSSKPQEDLNNLYAFPNPVRPGFEGNVIIDGLTDRARVKITDIEGNLVYEAVSQGGSIPWDTRSFSGQKVASGVYLLMVNTRDTIDTKVFKLMIVR